MRLITQVYSTPFAVKSGKREMTIADCTVIIDAVKWNECILLLQTLGVLKYTLAHRNVTQ